MARLVVALTFGWIASLVGAAGVSAGTVRERIIVRTYNQLDLSPRELMTARSTARAILQKVAIDVLWRPCEEPSTDASIAACHESIGPSELVVRLVAAPAGLGGESLGYSLVDIRQRSGCLATIFVDRVKFMASAAGSDASVLLGRAIAHELVHLLLGTTYHASRGLMRPHWTIHELAGDRTTDWMLSPGEGARMRRGLDARARRRVPREVQDLALAGSFGR